MKKSNQEIDYVEAILAMRTMLSLNNSSVSKLKMDESVSIVVADHTYIEKPIESLSNRASIQNLI